MAKTDFNQTPYFDDFDESDAFYRILFRPANAVQARELNQLQTILQNQIDRFGQHIFQPDTRVIGGELDFDGNAKWVDLTVASNANLSTLAWRETNLHGLIIEQQGSDPVQAHIITTSDPDGQDNVRCFIKYTNKGGAGGTTDTFTTSETLQMDGTAITFDTPSSSATGVASLATVKSGIYFIRGFFVHVDQQVVVLDSDSSTPTTRIGLNIAESIVTPEDDPDLLSNATGTRNEFGPGAHRFKITLTLGFKDPSDEGSEDDEDFVELIKVDAGDVVLKKENTEYSKIGDELARRTFDESGDYTVNPFIGEVKEHATDNTKVTLALDPGKAYVRGYEIETIGTTEIDVDKGRDTASISNKTIRTPVGNYVKVTNVYKLPEIDDYDEVNLRDAATGTRGTGAGSVIGTAKTRAMEYETGTIGSESEIYSLYLFDISINSGSSLEHVKQVQSATNSFTADISLSEIQFEGTVTNSGVDNTVTGTGTFFVSKDSQALLAGDTIKVGSDLIEVSTVTNDTAFEATADPADFTDSNFSLVFCELFETGNNKLIYSLPNNFIKTIRDTGAAVDTNYVAYMRFASETVTAGDITLSASSGETFEDLNSANYLITVVTDGSAGGDLLGDIVDPGTLTAAGEGTNSLTISGLDSSDVVDVIAAVRKTGGSVSQEKTKTLQTSGSDTTASGDDDLNIVSLSEGDISQITGIFMAADFTTVPVDTDTDITDRYDLDNGQRDNYYGLGRILLKSGENQPTGRLLIEYDYFSHSGNGNYFSVDSYAVNYEDIPSYTSSSTGEVFSLRDCMDFRPLVNSTGTAFDNSTGSLTDIPKSNVSADYDYYLNRIDLLYLDYKGSFHIIAGTSGIDPEVPQEPEDGMVLYQVNVRAYTLDKKEVFLNFRENKRYTMRDIGKLEKRVKNLEYYTTLNLLEKETEDLQILDDNGLNKFKNGFIVDPFTGHGIGDVKDPDYRCSIDMQEGELRPQFYQDVVQLIDENTTDGERTTDGYQKTGDLLTLPYTEESMVEQLVASTAINVNPYAVFSFIGTIDLDPSDDMWKDTDTLPTLIVNQEGNYDSMVEVADAYGTVWNEWEENWTGSTVTKDRSRRIVKRGDNSPDKVHRKEWPAKLETITRTTTTKSGMATRSGTRIRVVPETVKTDLGEKVVSVNYIPFMRTREVQITAEGFKPNARLYPFFDGTDVAGYSSAWSDPDTPEAFDSGDLISTGTALITDARGKAGLTLNIPNSDALRFKTGQRVFRLTDRSTNDENWTTSGEQYYRAQGILETKQRTILSTRNARLVQEAVADQKAISQATQETKRKTKWIDPVAQSFLVTESGGAFITSIDLWFETKDSNIPVTVQIREMINGSPGQRILPFGEKLIDATDINTNLVSSGVLEVNGTPTTLSPVAANFTKTTCTFESPVYVEEGVEYCVTVLSNSNNYEIWKATLGETQIGSEFPVAEQPYAGSLFKSQNASTWTAEQESDLMVQINKAKFSIGGTGIVTFTNDALSTRTLADDPFRTANGSTTVRVIHPNHGMVTSSSVTIAGVSGTQNNIPDTELNTTHTISDVEFDSYTISVTTSANATGSTGGSGLTATEDKSYSTLHPIIANLILPGTDIIYGIKSTSGKSIHGTESAYTTDAAYSNVIANKNIPFETQRIVASSINETNNLSGNKSLFFRGTMSSTNDNISPVIDLGRVGCVVVNNRVDSPSYTGTNNINVADLDIVEIVSNSSNVAFSGSIITVDDATQAYNLSVIEIGHYIVTTDASNAENDGTWRVTVVDYDDAAGDINITVDGSFTTEAAAESTTVDIAHHSRFKSEYAPSGGSMASKYICRAMQLASPANSIRISFDAYRHTDSEIEVYYKILPVGSTARLDDLAFVKMTEDSTVDVSDHEDVFVEYNYTLEGLDNYATVIAKIVMKSVNQAHPTRIRDFRMISLTA